MKITIKSVKTDNSYNLKQTRVFVTPVGETVLENLVSGRHTRPYTMLRSPVIEVLKGLGFGNPRVGWSRNAGCSCPCSPGFIVRGEDGAGMPGTVWIDYAVE